MSEITEEKAPAAKQDDPASEKEVINTFQTLRQEASQLFSKINELENEKAEHALVIDAIKDLDPKRKCFRLIGGVLVERTVEEVLPAVQKNTDGLSAVSRSSRSRGTTRWIAWSTYKRNTRSASAAKRRPRTRRTTERRGSRASWRERSEVSRHSERARR